MYQLAAVIAGAGPLRDLVAGTSHGVVAVLRRGLEMVPVSRELAEEMTGVPHRDTTGEPMSPAFDRVLAAWSVPGPIAFVQADFWAGDGRQTAVVWRDGTRSWGPVFDEEFAGPQEQWPINAALARLGLQPGPDLDLFDEVALGMQRDLPDWQDYARSGRTPAYYEEQARKARLQAEERELAQIRPPLDGQTIMKLLNIPAGPLVGAAIRRLRRRDLEQGPLSPSQAEADLRTWAEEQGLS